MEALELGDGYGGNMVEVADEIKTSDEERYSSQRYTSRSNPNWLRTRYVGALLGKSVRAAQGAYLNSADGLGYAVKGLEGE